MGETNTALWGCLVLAHVAPDSSKPFWLFLAVVCVVCMGWTLWSRR